MEESGETTWFVARELWKKKFESIMDCNAQKVIANHQGYAIFEHERWQNIHHHVHVQEVQQQLEEKDMKFVRTFRKVPLNAEPAMPQMLFDKEGRKWIHRGQVFEVLYRLMDPSTTFDQLKKKVKSEYSNIADIVVEDFFCARCDLLLVSSATYI
jgi:hypothetical protein